MAKSAISRYKCHTLLKLSRDPILNIGIAGLGGGAGGFGQGGFGGGGQFGGYPGGSSSSGSKCWGTDPNRNFDIAHATVGSSNNPCQDTFHGDRAFSEAESQAFKTTLEKIIGSHGGPNKVIYVSVHAYSQLWMFPNGHIKSKSAHHYDLKRVADRAVSDLRFLLFMKNRHFPIFLQLSKDTFIF